MPVAPPYALNESVTSHSASKYYK